MVTTHTYADPRFPIFLLVLFSDCHEQILGKTQNNVSDATCVLALQDVVDVLTRDILVHWHLDVATKEARTRSLHGVALRIKLKPEQIDKPEQIIFVNLSICSCLCEPRFSTKK